MTHIAYWGTMLIIPASALITALAAIVLARWQDRRSMARESQDRHHTPAE